MINKNPERHNQLLTYIWRTELGACATCQAPDGTKYSSTDEIPDKPHPNCKCYIDVVENYEDDEEYNNDKEDNTKEKLSKNENLNYDDNSDKIKKECYDLTDETIGNCDSLIDEIKTAINEFNTIVYNEIFENIKDKIEENIENLTNFLNELSNISFSLKDLYFNIRN